MAQLLGQVAVGSIVKLNENGSPTNYIVVNQGIPGNSPLYDVSCNGTWLLRQDCQATGIWGSTNVFAGSDIQQYMNTYIPALFDADIRSKIVAAKIPYCVGNGSNSVNSGADGLEVQCFPLSAYEYGFNSIININSPDGATLSYFSGASGADMKRAALFAGSYISHWTRSVYYDPSYADAKYNGYVVNQNGGYVRSWCNVAQGYRPAVIFPQSMVVLDNGTLSKTLPAPTLTVPSQAMQGQSIPINWTASANADSYQLQRKVDSGEWTTIYTGPNLTFTDTAGSWSTVQYQVAAGLGGEYGEYATSAVIPVVSASALVISGTNEDLGTITADIPYTVTSDTGNQITHTLTVNGVQFATATEASGVAHSIPVMELPTGTGTIVITASVQATSGPVTATRTWTYTKTAQTFPASAGVGSLAQNGASFLPQTLAECVRTNSFWGGSLSTALEMLTGVAANGAQFEVGSYTGTDTYGSGNPTSYTFSKIPRIIFIISSATQDGMGVIIPNDSSGFGGKTLDNGWDFWVVNCTGTTVQWYSNGNALKQMNFASYSPYKILAFY